MLWYSHVKCFFFRNIQLTSVIADQLYTKFQNHLINLSHLGATVPLQMFGRINIPNATWNYLHNGNFTTLPILRGRHCDSPEAVLNAICLSKDGNRSIKIELRSLWSASFIHARTKFYQNKDVQKEENKEELFRFLTPVHSAIRRKLALEQIVYELQNASFRHCEWSVMVEVLD